MGKKFINIEYQLGFCQKKTQQTISSSMFSHSLWIKSEESDESLPVIFVSQDKWANKLPYKYEIKWPIVM